jgi:hypothetical protein
MHYSRRTYVKFGKEMALGLPVVGSTCAASSLALRCIGRMHVDVDDEEEMTETREIERPLINRLPESIFAHTTLLIKTQLTAFEKPTLSRPRICPRDRIMRVEVCLPLAHLKQLVDFGARTHHLGAAHLDFDYSVTNLTPSTTQLRHRQRRKPSRCRYVALRILSQCWIDTSNTSAVPQVIPHQAEACARAEAEPPHPSVDSPQDQQHHQVRLFCLSRTTHGIAHSAMTTVEHHQNIR